MKAKEWKLKVRVMANCTACAAMRVKRVNDSFSDFVCGVDLANFVFIANSPRVYDRTFAGLAKNVVNYELNMKSGRFYNPFDHTENIEEIRFYDDSEVMCTGIDDMDEYYTRRDEVFKEQKALFDKVAENALRGLEKDEDGSWVGYITVYEY